MKIEGIRPVQGVGSYEPARRINSAWKPREMGSDGAEFSAGALSFASTLKALKSSMTPTAQDAERAKGIEDRVNRGDYRVDAYLVAEKLLGGVKLDREA